MKRILLAAALAAAALGPVRAADFGPQEAVTIVGASRAVLGSYCMAADSGTMTAGLAGASPIFSLRYTGSNVVTVRKILLSAGDTATAFTAGVATFDLFVARTFTASDTGGTASTLTGNNGKMRTLYPATGMGDFRIASTGALGAGTRTLDATQAGAISTSIPATAGNPIIAPGTPLFVSSAGEQPLQLLNNEGAVLQATVPATGTWTFSVQVCWDENTPSF